MKPSVFMLMVIMTVTISSLSYEDKGIIGKIKKRQQEEAAKAVTNEEHLKDLKVEKELCSSKDPTTIEWAGREEDEYYYTDDDTPKDAATPKNVAISKAVAIPDDDFEIITDMGRFATIGAMLEKKGEQPLSSGINNMLLGFIFFVGILIPVCFLYNEYRRITRRKRKYHNGNCENILYVTPKRCTSTPNQWY